MLDDLALDRALEAEVELLERLALREARGLDPALAAVAIPGGHLGREQYLGEALVAPGLLARPLGQLRPPRGCRRRLQRPEQVRSSEVFVMPGSRRHSGRAAAARRR